ncbi:MAG TPA: hypothetical protein VHE53_01965 [Patescibacteria group bacterium]|nr:hypothetical protein [Patescibacteria group bacterium]
MRGKIKQRGQAMIALILAIIIVGSIFMTGGIKKHVDQQVGEPFEAQITGLPDQTSGNNLQLKTFTFISPTPGTTPLPHPGVGIDCKPGQLGVSSTNLPSCGIGIFTSVPQGADAGTCCVEDGAVNDPNQCCSGVQVFQQCAISNYWCDAKPVIYLYPDTPTKVNVKVTIPGKITVSIPEYKNEWENVLADPDGKLSYQGKTYPYLFYETMQDKANSPTYGAFVLKKDLRNELIKITSALGLNKSEQKDFLSYWIPRLNEVNKKYILVSYFAPDKKDSVDKVDIDPKPDTFIQFIMYYKGVDKPYSLPKLTLPNRVQERIGFTAVEWGGILED